MKMLFRAPGNEGNGNGFNWAGQYSFGQEFLPEDNLETRKRKAEKQVRRLTDTFKWLEDGSLEITQHIPGKPKISSFISRNVRRFHIANQLHYRTSATAWKQPASMVQRTCWKTWDNSGYWRT